MTKEEMELAERRFKIVIEKNEIKIRSKKFYEAQYFYFHGICHNQKMPPKWAICILSNREIIE